MPQEPGLARRRGDVVLPISAHNGVATSLARESGIVRNAGVERLLGTPVSTLPQEQLGWYRPENLQFRSAGTLNPGAVLDLIRRSQGVPIGYADYGADKAAAGILEAGEDGRFNVVTTIAPRIKREDESGGTGYVDFSEDAAAEFRRHGVRLVGISLAGPTEGTKPIHATNTPVLQDELNARYDGDLAGIFQPVGTDIGGTQLAIPGEDTRFATLGVDVGGTQLQAANGTDAVIVAGDNDGIAALVASTLEAYRVNPKVKRVILLIFGGGNGGSYFEISDMPGGPVLLMESVPESMPSIVETGEMTAAEPGHVPVIAEMNPFGRIEPCGLASSPTKDVTCIEKVGGGNEGVVKTVLQETGKNLKGPQINQIHQGTGPDAALMTSIYDAAARVIALEAFGMDEAINIKNGQVGTRVPLDSDTVVVVHGGLTKAAGVPERVIQYIDTYLQEQGYDHTPQVLFTKDFSDNACADGAATLALMAAAALN